MSGVDTVRGISYQHAQAVLAAIEIAEDEDLGSIRVEGIDDIMDIEIYDNSSRLVRAMQVKTRSARYHWSATEICTILKRWAALEDSAHASFQFVTDGALGPTAQAFSAALDSARNANSSELARLLEVGQQDPIVRRIMSATIRQDSIGVEPILREAERQLRTLLPGSNENPDTAEEARAAIDRIFREISTRAGAPNKEDRLIDREEIGRILGGYDRLNLREQWPGELRNAYIAALQLRPKAAIEPTVMRPADTLASELHLLDILRSVQLDRAGILYGSTGSGKTTAIALLARLAATRTEVVISVNAEQLVAGRLAALVAEAVSNTLGRNIPSSTGRQILEDSGVILAIDGASEIPHEIADQIRESLRALASRYRASVLLSGRSLTALRSCLPLAFNGQTYILSGFDYASRRELATRHIERLRSQGQLIEDSAYNFATRIEVVLGDAAGNPMLFTMALDLALGGLSFNNRASIYASTIGRMAMRSGAPNPETASAAVGIVFGRLISEGRRYAHPIEWQKLLNDAVQQLSSLGVPIDGKAVTRFLDRSGLIAPVGFTQIVAPIHDSYADFLAGAAHAHGLTSFPDPLTPNDDQRVIFAAELADLAHEKFSIVSRDRPFLTPRLADKCQRQLAVDFPDIAGVTLANLLPLGHESFSLKLWKSEDRTVGYLLPGPGEHEWVTPTDGKAALRQQTPSVVCNAASGPQTVAVRLWHLYLSRQLNSMPFDSPFPHCSQPEVAIDLLDQHSQITQSHLLRIIPLVSPRHGGDELLAEIGPLGLEAYVGNTMETALRHVVVPVRYRYAKEVLVQRELPELEGACPHSWSASDAESILRERPAVAAAKRIRSAIEKLSTCRLL